MTTQKPSRVVADRVREIRRRDGLSAQKLADRCAQLGMPELSRAVISNLENGRREAVTVDEVFVLAAALGVSPAKMLPLIEREVVDRVTVDDVIVRRVGAAVEVETALPVTVARPAVIVEEPDVSTGRGVVS